MRIDQDDAPLEIGTEIVDRLTRRPVGRDDLGIDDIREGEDEQRIIGAVRVLEFVGKLIEAFGLVR